MAEHTPGPWSVGDKPGVWVGPVITANSGKKGIAFVVGQTDSGWLGGYETSAGEDRTNANARLIAAAPELLTALKSHIPWKKAGQPDKPGAGWGIWQDAIDAINKAEGGTL